MYNVYSLPTYLLTVVYLSNVWGGLISFSMDSTTPPSTMTSITLSNNCENFNFDQFVEQLNQKNQMGKNFASKLSLYQQQLKNINSFAHRYDPKLGLKTNGFRSFLKVRQDFLMHIPKSMNWLLNLINLLVKEVFLSF